MKIEVKVCKVYADGSGAPAVVYVGGSVFAIDFHGEVKCCLIGGSDRTRVTAAVAKREYEKKLRAVATPGWFVLNREMYR